MPSNVIRDLFSCCGPNNYEPAHGKRVVTLATTKCSGELAQKRSFASLCYSQTCSKDLEGSKQCMLVALIEDCACVFEPQHHKVPFFRVPAQMLSRNMFLKTIDRCLFENIKGKISIKMYIINNSNFIRTA